MEYDKLSKVFYKNGSEHYNYELEKRKNGYSSYLTGLSVKGFQKGALIGEEYELFYVNIHRLAQLNNRVLLNSLKVSSLVDSLPVFVVEPYFHKLLINEAQSNNDIEGIRSTKKELKEVLADIQSYKGKNKRFEGFIKTYLFIDKIEPFRELSDFRALYDTLVSDEIDEANKPDGELFRKEYVEISDGVKVKHMGVSSEERIKECLSSLLDFLEDQNHLELYRYMVAHYYYEYIHPFYDGNGRTGRLLLCSYISRYLEKYSAITFSYAVNKNKSKYYKALEEIPAKLNRGELTFYLIDMLEILLSGQEEIIEDLELSLSKIDRIEDYFNTEKWINKDDQVQLLKVLTYIEVFTSGESEVLARDLESICKKSRYKLSKIAEELLENGTIEVSSKRPKSYRLSDKIIEDIMI